MMVNNPLEIYATIVGAKMFDHLFNIMVSFGFAFVPILIILGHAFHRLASSPFDNVASPVIRSVLLQLLMYCICLLLFIVPSFPISLSSIKFIPHCTLNAKVSYFLNTGTTLDDTLGETINDGTYDNIKLPPGMAFFLEAVSGVTGAAIESLGCPLDIGQAEKSINTTRLTPTLKTQVERFNHECYLPAKAKYDATPSDHEQAESIDAKYGGVEDLAWVGSHTFQELYYTHIYAKSPVSGFSQSSFPGPYAQNNQDAGVPVDDNGMPDCLSWWTDSSNGLQAQLNQLVDQHDPSNPHLGYFSSRDTISSWIDKVTTMEGLGSQITADDVIAHDLLYNVGAEAGFGSNENGDLSIDSEAQLDITGLNQALRGAVGQAVQGLSKIDSTIKRQGIAKEIPIYQAILFALLLSLGPIILVVGCYRLHVIFSYYFLTASLIFVTYIESFLSFLEKTLHASMGYDLYAASNYSTLYNVFTHLYFIAPLAFLSMMGLCGVQVGGAIKDITGTSESKGGAALSGVAAKFIKV
jgi:hypothetical protein